MHQQDILDRTQQREAREAKARADEEDRMLQRQRDEEYHAARMAALAKSSGFTEINDNTGESPITLPPSAKDLEIILPGVSQIEYEKIWKGTFQPVNLSRLRLNAAKVDEDEDDIVISAGKVSSKRPKGQRKDFANKEIWFEGFSNYVSVVQTIHNCPPKLIPMMLAFSNKIRTLSYTHEWMSAVLNLALDFHTQVMQKGQLEPDNWAIPLAFEGVYIGWQTIKGPQQKTQAKSKRSRVTSSPPTPGVQDACWKWNVNQPCAKKPCQHRHVCILCEGEHRKKDCTK